jgi:hypothetical protein
MRKIVLAAAALALPGLAQAEEFKLDPELARYALEMKHVKCDETGLLEKDGRILITCANGQAYAVILMKPAGKEPFVSVQRFNKLTNTFSPI